MGKKTLKFFNEIIKFIINIFKGLLVKTMVLKPDQISRSNRFDR